MNTLDSLPEELLDKILDYSVTVRGELDIYLLVPDRQEEAT